MNTTERVIVIVIRVLVVVAIVWYSSYASSKTRLFSGYFTALTSGILSLILLEPRFFNIGLELADVALYVLAILAGCIGMSLGVLLPIPFAGACFGVSLALLLGMFLPSVIHFSILGLILAALGIVGAWWAHSLMFTGAFVLVSGAFASSFAWPSFFPYLTSVTLGHDSPLTHGPVEPDPKLGILWVVSSFVIFLSLALRTNFVEKLSVATLFRSGYTPIPTGEPTPSSRPPKIDDYQRKQTAPPGSAPSDAYNMFNPADLPPRLAEYANMVYHACEDLGNFFGFQDSSVRNQAEHLLILLSNNRRYMSPSNDIQSPSPIHALHAKVFSNYLKWCKSLSLTPNYSKINSMCMSSPPAVVSRVVDLVLYFCVWGEGANLRHMPECLWFLYHKMMEEYIKCEGYTQTRSLYAGHYLDHVVTPIYEIVQKDMKSNVDHQDKRNYDDVNEFFWSRDSLQYHYSSTVENLDIEAAEANLAGPLPGESLPPISEGLQSAPKTFLEKRSWLRGILALNRIIEWHVITFYLLSVIAFARVLVWGWVYSIQVASGVFWLFNLLYLKWGLIEVWSVYPGIHLSATAICGSVFTLVARFFILVYQTLYLMWTFGPQQGQYFGIEADSNFWWWQYIWLSVLCMAPYAVESILQFYPASTTLLYTSQNDYVQSFLNILFPLSRLYVGKEVHESFWRTATYFLFWFTLIAWKLLFSYMFEVYAMVLPTLELTDDYVNYENQSFAKMSLLLILRWSPQLLVYFIDMSIWYAVWQAVAGTAVGFREHLGDIKNIKDIRKNFVRAPESFCKKMLSKDAGSRRGSSASFLKTGSRNSICNPNNPEGESLLGSDPHKLQNYVNRLLDVRIQKWVMFSAAWNEIIDHFRQEDIISNRERDNLKFSRFDGFSQAIYLPVFQTAGVIDNALTELERPRDEKSSRGGGPPTDEEVFKPITKHVTMITAVSEVWELGSFLFLKLLGTKHNDDIVTVMNVILKWSENGSLSKHLKTEQMRGVINNMVDLVKIMEKGLSRRKPVANSLKKSRTNKAAAPEPAKPASGFRRAVSATSLITMEKPDRIADHTMTIQRQQKTSHHPEGMAIFDALRDQVRDKFRSMANSIKGLLKDADVDAEARDVLDRITFLLSMENGFLWDDLYASSQLDDVSSNAMFSKVLTKVHGLVACHPDDVEPKSKEARRRLTFFVNSLFMDMPDAPSIKDMFSWNVLTPFYSEDVTYTKSDLEKRTDALGVSTLLYLQTLYKNDWNNFLERMGIQDESKVFSRKFIEETRIWASLRAQTLTRTVSGMMYYEKALRFLANLERLDESMTNTLMGEKFGYVVACQVYGNMKKNQDPKADDIEQLMHRFPHLRVAYIDSIRLNRAGASAVFSVLVKSDGQGNIQEVYRVRLPGNPVIGEGKPENQNHAVIFTRGEFLQTIDMNQEGFFEEALKMRNALEEFRFSKRESPLPTTILGLREHIFTGSVSSLANYMALQETSFVTLGQRVLAKPLCIRLHYGHPDVFDKLFFMTRGGISKSSKGINLSEDIFAGYNNVIRGGQVAFKEYMQVGKGRDVGMSQIYKFEAKLSQGAAEQSLSRDVYRVCHRLDFCRLLSLYFGGIGHYFSNVLTVLTVYVVVYLMLVLAIFDLERIGTRIITPMGTIQMLLGGLGLLQTIPLFATLGVERGWWPSFREIIHVFITGGPLHFMFHIQTKANYMAQTILVGGAKYRATGRGFVTQHTPMDEQYRFFASSHLYLGVELGMGLILMGIYTDAGQYFGRTWSLWLASVSFLASPFWFNPLSFEWSVVTSDYDKYLRWMRGTTGGGSKSWSMWWTEENSYYKTIPLSSKLLFVIKAAIYVLIAEGVRRSDLFMTDTSLYKPMVSVTRVLIFIVIMLILGQVFISTERGMPYPIRRTIGILISFGLVAGIVLVFIEDMNCIRYALAAYYGVGAICQLGLLIGLKPVKYFYLIHDIVCGHIIFIPLFLLAAFQIPNYIQTWLLYHNALSSDVVVSDILRYARKNQEVSGANEEEDLVEQITELRRLVQKQEQILENAGLSTPGNVVRNTSTDAVAALVTPSSTAREPIPKPGEAANNNLGGGGLGGGAKRTMSLSGLDVWGDMALGDTTVTATPGFDSSVPTYQTSGTMMQPVAQQRGLDSGGQFPMQDFTFTQPDKMPPR